MAVVIILKKHYFRIIKNLTKCNILGAFTLKNYWKFADYNLEKFCPRSLASTIPVLGLKKVCPQKAGPWPWPRIFLSPWLWPRRLCPRIHLCYEAATYYLPEKRAPFFAFLLTKNRACTKQVLPVQTGLYRYDKQMVQEIYNENLRPGLHDQVFCTISWHQSCETSCKSMTHYCGHLSSITLNSSCEKENQTLESLPDFLRRNRTELYFLRKFSKGHRSQRRKLSF